MKADSRCLVCHAKQALRLLDLHVRNEAEKWEKLQLVMKEISKLPYGLKPIEMADTVYGTLSDLVGEEDPYADLKDKLNSLAEGILSRLEKSIRSSADPLYDSAKLAIAGNILDLGTPNWDGDKVFDRVVEILEKPFGINDFETFKDDLRYATTLLYIADNVGEIVFDRFFIEMMKEYNESLDVIVAVKRKPVINDATVEDAIKVGMDRVASVLDSGMEIPGTIVERASDEFRHVFYESDLVVSKGQGNFEGLIEESRSIYFLLVVKCDVVADFLKTPVGTLVFMKKE